jgi:TPR repeat protein
MRTMSAKALTFFLLAALLPLFLLCSPLNAAAPENAESGEEPRMISPENLFAALLVNAEKGQPQAMLNVGLFYEQGLGVQRNFTKALEWYEKAALAGEKEGWTRLGLCYETGMGITVDMARAVSCYEKAAALGSGPAQRKLASLYLQGRGLAKDEAKGFALLTQAANTGDGAAANELAVVHLNGLFGQKQDPAKAREWFMKSANVGNLEGVKNLAVILKDGIGQKADPSGALRWYLIAQKGGLQAPDLATVIADLKKSLQPAQVKKAETDADKWLTDYAGRMSKATAEGRQF